MTQVALDEVMLREPRLLVPGMQPLGLVRPSEVAVNSRAIMVAIIRSKALSDSRNLMDGFVGYTEPITALGASASGIGFDSRAVADPYGPAWWLNGKELVTTGPFSALWHGVVYSNATGVPAFGNSGGNNQWGLRPNWLANGDVTGSQTANAVTLLIYGSSAFSGVGAANAITYGKPFAVLGVRDGTTGRLFVDGKLLSEATMTQRDVSGAAAHQIGLAGWKASKYTSIGAWGGLASLEDASLHHMAAFWNRALTNGEAAAISADPYSLVSPA